VKKLPELSEDEIQRRRLLLEKFKDGNVSRKEAEELKELLEKEREQASQSGDTLLLFGILAVLGLVVNYLVGKKFDVESIKKDFDKFMSGVTR
jgi:hypothetical protein